MGLFSKKADNSDDSESPPTSSKSTPSLLDHIEPSGAATATSKPPPTGYVSGALHSGESGLGTQGAETLEAVRDGRTEGVVGHARGVAPEVVFNASGEKPRRLSFLRRATAGTTTPEDEKELEGAGAVSAVAPRGVTEGDVSAVEAEKEEEAKVVDRNGRNVPTSWKAGTPSVGDSVTTSIKERVLEEHDPSPKTSNEKFHKIFSQVPADDELIEDYRCALQREILIQGRLYVSENHLAFRANILGWETTTVVPWSEVTAIEKGKTALVLPNAIEISTLNAKHSFASLLSRDATYALLVTVWRHAHPEEARDDSRSALSDEMSYEDDTGEKKRFKFRPRLPAILRRRDSSSSASSGGEGLTEAQKVVKATRRGHPETKYEGEEYANVAGEFELPTSPETAYGLMFRDEEFLKSFWAENQKLKDMNVGEWSKEGGNEEREMTYIKPLNAAMGPKETLCEVKDETEKVDPESWIAVRTTTHTPDVPSGSGFFVKTRTVFTWSATGGTKVKITTEVEWTKVNRMLKGIIERSCLDGQKTYSNDVEAAVRAHIGEHQDEFIVAGAEEEKVEAAPAPSFLSTLLSFLPSPIVLLSILVVVLLFGNFFTLMAMRQQARAAHKLRIGSPDEVASVVGRVLSDFKEVHGARVGRENAERVRVRVREVAELAARMEMLAKELSVRAAGLV